jgi:hypothetical protein
MPNLATFIFIEYDVCIVPEAMYSNMFLLEEYRD